MNKYILLLLLLSLTLLSGCVEKRFYSDCVSCRGSWLRDINRSISGLNITGGNGSTVINNYYLTNDSYVPYENATKNVDLKDKNLSIGKMLTLKDIYGAIIGNITAKINQDGEKAIIVRSQQSVDYFLGSGGFFNIRNKDGLWEYYVRENGIAVTRTTGTSTNWYSAYTVGNQTKNRVDTINNSLKCKEIYKDEFNTYNAARYSGVGTCAAVSSGTAAATTDIYMGTIRFSDSTTINGGFRCYSAYTMYFIGGEKINIRFKPNTNVLNTTIRIGFADSTTVAAPTDGCYLQCFNLNCTGYCKNNAGPTATTTTYTLTANTWYTYTGEMNSAATSMNFSIYNAAKTTLLWSKAVTGNIPNTNARVFGNVIEAYQSTASAAAILVNWDYVKLEDCTYS